MSKPKTVRVIWGEDGLEIEASQDVPVRPPRCDMRGGIVTNYRSEQVKIIGSYRFIDEHCGTELFAVDPDNGKLLKKVTWVIPRLLPGASIVVNNWMEKAELNLEADGPRVFGKTTLMPEKMAVVTWGPLDTVKIIGEVC